MSSFVKHPVVLYILEPTDPSYDKGGRFRIDDVKGDQFFFYTEPDARLFVTQHNLNLINESEMIELRKAIKDSES